MNIIEKTGVISIVWAIAESNCATRIKFVFVFFFLLLLFVFLAVPAACGSSQARDRLHATAAT